MIYPVEFTRSSNRCRDAGIRALSSWALAATVIMLATFLVPTSTAAASGREPTNQRTAPLSGTVTGTVSVTGAPKGFAPALTAVGACKSGAFATCSSPQFSLADGAPYTFTLPDGTWHIQGFYVLAPFGGAFLGTPATVTVADRQDHNGQSHRGLQEGRIGEGHGLGDQDPVRCHRVAEAHGGLPVVCSQPKRGRCGTCVCREWWFGYVLHHHVVARYLDPLPKLRDEVRGRRSPPRAPL